MNPHAHIREVEPPAAFPSEARATLAAAIAVMNTAKRSENEAKEVFNRLRVQGWEAANRVEETAKAVEEARSMLVMRSAHGASVLGDRLLKNSLDAKAQVKEEVDRLAVQREEARLILSDAEFQSRKAAEKVPDAACAVVMDEIEDLLKAAIAAQEIVIQHRLVLRNTVRQAHDPSGTNPRLQGAIDFLSAMEFPSMNNGWDGHPVSHRWAVFFRDLQEDPNTRIPK